MRPFVTIFLYGIAIRHQGPHSDAMKLRVNESIPIGLNAESLFVHEFEAGPIKPVPIEGVRSVAQKGAAGMNHCPDIRPFLLNRSWKEA